MGPITGGSLLGKRGAAINPRLFWVTLERRQVSEGGPVPVHYAIDAVNSFRGFYYAEGWAHDGNGGVPPELIFEDRLLPAWIERVNRPDLAALSAPGLCGFRLRYIMREGEVPREFSIRFRTTTEQVTIENPGLDLFNRSLQASHETLNAFFSRLRPGAFDPRTWGSCSKRH
jgi:hypothetical protein